MGMRRLLIDTNIYSYALRGDDGVVEVLRKAEQIGFSVISIGYYFLVLKGRKGTEEQGRT
jgi:tRNA(fMet)-specific endonuclease VapC